MLVMRRLFRSSLRSRRFRGRIRNGKSLEREAKNGRSLKKRARARGKRARGKWEGRKIKRLPETICFCIFRVRQRTLKADWLMSHQVFPYVIHMHVDIYSNVKMAVLIENIDNVISQAISDIQLVTSRFIQLKEEQARAVRDLLRGKDVFAILPTGFGKSLIYQVFVRARDYQRQGNAAILVISPLNSIIKDQLKDMEQQGYSAVDASITSVKDMRECKFKIMYASAEMARKNSFRDVLKDPSSPLHQNIAAIVVDESHTVETWTGKRYGLVFTQCNLANGDRL